MSGTHLRILTLNIHKGFAMGPRRLVLSHIREQLRASQADLVFLQEVVGDNQKHRRKLQHRPRPSWNIWQTPSGHTMPTAKMLFINMVIMAMPY